MFAKKAGIKDWTNSAEDLVHLGCQKGATSSAVLKLMFKECSIFVSTLISYLLMFVIEARTSHDDSRLRIDGERNFARDRIRNVSIDTLISIDGVHFSNVDANQT